MKVLRQKNVYFIDLSKDIYRGFVETSVLRSKGEDVAVYKASGLEILKVEVLTAGTSVDARYEVEDITGVIDKYEESFGVDMWREICTDNMVRVRIPEDVEDETLTIRIVYRSREDNDGVGFYRATSGRDKHREVIGTNRVFDSSSIFPALATEHKNEWELVYVLPNTEEAKIVSPGVFRSMREEENVTLYSYYVDQAHSGHLNFCVGTFEGYEITTGDDKRMVYVPKGLESHKECGREFCGDMENVIRYSEYFLQREYPFKTLSIAFVFGDGDRVYGQNTAFVSIGDMTSTNDIEPMFMMKMTAADIVSSQIFYFYFSVFDGTDFWIFEGMKGYFEDYCVRYFLGNNEFLYRLKKDRDYVVGQDVTEYALYDRRRTWVSQRSRFFRTKAKVFFHVLEGNLSRAFMEKISNYAVKRREEVGENYSGEFIRLVRDVTGKDLRPLFETYVFRPGTVEVRLSFVINKKNNKVDFRVRQSPTSILGNANRVVHGPITVRAHEMEGVFEHVFAGDQENSFYYHPRTKKKKKSEDEEEMMPLLWMRADPKGEHLAKMVVEQPDYMFIEQLLDKNVTGQMEALESLSIKPSTQVCEIFERVLENSHMFYKIRIEVLYILSRIVIGTYYGFQRLIQYFIKKYCVQTSTVVKPNDFLFIPYFIQKHVVKALSVTDPYMFKSYSGREVGSASIVCAFIMNILRFNDNSLNSYSDSWYLASVIEDLSFPVSSMNYSRLYWGSDGRRHEMPGDENQGGGDEISELFRSSEVGKRFDGGGASEVGDESSSKVDFCKSDDVGLENKGEEHGDEDRMDGVSGSTCHRERVEANSNTNYSEMSINEIERFRILDMVFPSHRNLVTSSCIYALGRLSLFGKANIRRETLAQLCEYPNFSGVRAAALEVLAVLFYRDGGVLDFVLRKIRTETFATKHRMLGLLGELCSCSRFEVKEALKKRRKELFSLLRSNQGNIVIKEKISDLIYFIEDRDLALEEYHKAVASAHEDTLSTDTYRAFNILNEDVRKEVQLTVRLSNIGLLKKKLLQTEYTVRLPLARGKRNDALGMQADRRTWGTGPVSEASTRIRLPGCFKMRLKIPSDTTGQGQSQDGQG